MSTSYPAPAGEIETKNILKLIQEENQSGEKSYFNKSISKQTFLCILIIDIILSGVYFTVNSILAAHLIFSDKQNNLRYGVLMMIIPWIPAVLIIPNEIFYKTSLFEKNSKNEKILSVFTAIVFFPIWSICLFISSFRNLTITSRLKRLDKVNSMKQIIHSNLHMLLMIFLIMRGRLLQEDDASCITDDLGRSVCFTFPVIVSLILSVIFIIVKGSIAVKRESLKSLLSLACLLMFRTVSFAFILTYIDYWSAIPFFLLFILQIVLFEYSKKDKPFEDKEVDCDDTDAPCVLIWNGNGWVPREPGPGLDLDEENSTQQNKPINISTVITASLNIFISRNIFEGLSKQNMFLTFVTNLLILAVIAIIFILVAFFEQFNYESNILSFNSFIAMTVILFCYGLFSLLFQKYYLFDNMKPVFIITFVSIVFSIIIIIALPLTIIVFKNFNRSNHAYFYTINSNVNITEIKTFSVQMNHEVSVSAEQIYLFNEIMWNIDDTSHINITNNNIKLVFCYNSLNCDNLNIKHALKIHFDTNNVLRQSSPTSLSNIGNSGTLFSIFELYDSAKESGHVYFSNSEPTIERITYVLNCSNSHSISTLDLSYSNDNRCAQVKYLNYDLKITEKKCFKYNEKIIPLDILCRRQQHLNKITFNNQKNQLLKNQQTFYSGLRAEYCCLNSSHFLENYGECSDKLSLSYLDSKSYNYETPNCPIFNHRKHSLFRKTSGNCLVSLSSHTECDDDSIYAYCDTTLFSCNDIVY